MKIFKSHPLLKLANSYLINPCQPWYLSSTRRNFNCTPILRVFNIDECITQALNNRKHFEAAVWRDVQARLGNSPESLDSIVNTISNMQEGYNRDSLLDSLDRKHMTVAAANIRYRLRRAGGGGNSNNQGDDNSNSQGGNSPSGTSNNNSSSVSTNTRASFPRIRFDQLMSFCWTVLLPLVIALIILVPCILYSFEIIPTNIYLL